MTLNLTSPGRKLDAKNTGLAGLASSRPDGSPAAVLLSHHKCASRFLSFYLQEYCRQTGLTLFESPVGLAQPSARSHISHLYNAVYSTVTPSLSVPAIHIIRNPLDIIVSAYWSHRNTHALTNWPRLQRQREILRGCGVDEGLYLTLAFLEQGDFYPDTPGPLAALRSWKFDDARVRTVRMEDMINDIDRVIGEPLTDIFGCKPDRTEPDSFTFEKLSNGRRPGEIDESSHYRSGLPGAWRSTLPEPIIVYVRSHYRELLKLYYPDSLA